MERRTRYDIYQDILETVRRRGATGITRISYGANLPVDRAKDAVEFLMGRNLLEDDEYGGNIKFLKDLMITICVIFRRTKDCFPPGF